MEFNITIRTNVLNITPIELDEKHIEKVIDKNIANQQTKTFLIYGENGIGKTTLSECLRIQDKAKNEYPIKKIDLSLFNNTQTYVYNRHFVSENVHNMSKMSDTKDITKIVIGENTKSYYDKVEATVKEKHEIEDNLTTEKTKLDENENKKHSIISNLKSTLTDKYSDILKKPQEEIDNEILKLQNSLPEIKDESFGNPLLVLKQLPEHNLNQETLNSIFNNKITVLSEEREDELFKFCEFLTSQRKWYMEGITALDKTNDLCHFCHQSVNNIETKKLIDDYKLSLFDNQLKAMHNSINNHIKLIENHIKNITGVDTTNKLYNLKELNEPIIGIDIDTLKSELQLLIDKLQEKQNNSSIVIPTFSIQPIIDKYNQYNNKIEFYNQKISQYNNTLSEKKKERETALINKNEIEKQINIYKQVIENREKFIEMLNNVTAIDSEITDTTIEIQILTKKLNEIEIKLSRNIENYNKQAQKEIDTYKDEINRILSEFHFDFEIKANINIKNDNRSKKTIGDIDSQYTIHRKDTQDCVDTKKLNYSLSEGEKNALGLAFFMAQLPKDLSKDTLVFDDPMTSFDISRAYKTSDFIAKIVTKYTIILTHHNSFATKMFYAKGGNVFCLKLEKNDNNKTVLTSNRNFLEKDQFFDIYTQLLTQRMHKNYTEQTGTTRKLVELILTNAYLISKKDIDELSSTYEKIRIGKQQNGRNMSLIKEIGLDKVLKQDIKIFLDHYDCLSIEYHPSNIEKMHESELKSTLDKVYEDICRYMMNVK